MKIRIIIFIFFHFFSFISYSQVGIGTTSPNATSKLEVNSNSKGFLLPRMTILQRNAIVNPTAGLQVWCTDCGANGNFQVFNGTFWVNSSGVANYLYVPSAPLNVVATVLGYTSASVSFSTPESNGGSIITSYTISSSPAGISLTTSNTSVVVTGLNSGTTYTFFVVATNSVGNSSSASATPVTLPVINGNAICDGTAYFDYNELTSTTGRIWMDRNLGATRTAQNATDYYAYGCLYQWGRGNDGHGSINWSDSSSGIPVNSSNTSLSSTNSPNNSLFIINASTPNDWLSNQNNSLWQYSSSINNPCPSGYFVPTAAEFAAEYSAYSITNTSSAFNNGPGGGFKFVSAGYRNGTNATIVNTSTFGNYWTQSINTTNALSYSISSSSATSAIVNRNNGFSIRCIKGASNEGAVVLSAHPQDGSMLLQFSKIASATDYIIYYKLNTDATFNIFTDEVSTNTFASVTGLNNGTLYDFKVQAILSNNSPLNSNVISIAPSTAVLNNSYHQILTTGQSLSLGAGPAITTSQIYTNKMLDASQTSLLPLVEPTPFSPGRESTSNAMATFISSTSINSNGSDYKSIVTVGGSSGAGYAQLKKNGQFYNGEYTYSNNINKLLAAKNIASSLGLPYVISAFTVVHGETDNAAAASVYKGYLEQWQNDLETDSKLITGQTGTIPMFLCQMSSYANTSYTVPSTQIGQWLAAEANPTKIFLVTPKYIFDHRDDGNTYVHLYNVSHRRLGEYYGKVMKKVLVDGVAWKPLSPSSVSISANVITVNFYVPVAPLQFDTVKVMSTANYGFEYYDASNSATITNVAIGSNGTSVIITLSNTPTGANKKIAYAYTNTRSTGYGGGRYLEGSAKGNLRDSDTTPALYTDNLPSNYGTELNNWCVHFIKDLN